MTTQQYIAKLRNKLAALKANNLPLAKAVATVHADQMERIFVKGKASDGGSIGEYKSLSYIKLRKKKRRQVNFIDLKYSGQLQKDLSNSLTKVNPNKWVTGTKNPANSKKLEAAETRNGKIGALDKSEKGKFKDVLQKEVFNALK